MGAYDEGNGHGGDDDDSFRKRKGKERALDEPQERAIFDVGDSDDEDGYKSADDRLERA